MRKGWAWSVSLAVLLPAALVGQEPEGPGVTGTVVDQRNQDPVFEAAVRLMLADGLEVIVHGRTDADGRYVLLIPRDRELPDGPVVVEAGAFGYGISVSEPFELRADDVTEVSTLALSTEPFGLDTLAVEVDRPWWYIPPPRERVLDRQLRGKGTFLAGATISAAEERDLAWVLATRVEGLQAIEGRRGPSLGTVMGSRCLVPLVNEWPVVSTRVLESIPRDQIAAVEIYQEWEEVPEELRFHVFTDQRWPLCGVINVWLWSSWNRGIEARANDG